MTEPCPQTEVEAPIPAWCLATAGLVPGLLQGLVKAITPKLQRIAEFLFAQGISTAATAIYGLLCVRALPIPDYAQFAVVFGYLGSINVLTDIGVSGTLASLVGERVTDHQLIADYVASIRELRRTLIAIAFPLTAIVYPLLVRHQHWSFTTVAAMVAILVVTSWFSGVSSSYGAVLILRRSRRDYYRIQMTSNLLRLTLLGVFWAFHWLNALTAMLISVSGVTYIAIRYYQCAGRLLGTRGEPSRQMQKAVIRLALPNSPNIIFYAIQGQVSLMIIAIFGRTTGLASVGALARIGQLFVMMSLMNSVLVEPYFARLPSHRLKSTYLKTLALVGAAALGMVGFAASFPEVFLWLLGHKYSHLRTELVWTVAGSAINYFSGVIWIINFSRRFVFWWASWLNIVVIILVQVFFIWRTDLSSVRTVLILTCVSGLASLCVNALSGIYGFARGPRQVEYV
jgi:O-antigen/teichoic acid export membrane protein